MCVPSERGIKASMTMKSEFLFVCLVLTFGGVFFYILIFQNFNTSEGAGAWIFSFDDIHVQNTGRRTAYWGEWSVYKGFCVWSLNSDYVVSRANDSVTLCTQGSLDYLYHLSELCIRWKGPISVAVYGHEQFNLVKTLIYKFRKCDSCVRSFVSWHVFYESAQCPTKTGYPTFSNFWKCNNSYLKNEVGKKMSPYPINVGRNLARLKSRTHFVMSSDIELYPSKDIIPRFLRMLRDRSPVVHWGRGLKVWVLPVFEVDSKVEAPTKKDELGELFHSGKAISFHKYRCALCHRIPNLEAWMKVQGHHTSLSVTETLKRDKQQELQDWEPFYIGTLNDPAFDTRLTWEGKQNKMQVAFEMCLLNYDFLVLDDAFLVHSPGINKYDASKETFRMKYVRENNKIMKAIKEELLVKYPNATKC